METRAHYALIGAFALLVTLGALAFAVWLARISTAREYAYYDVVFTEAVTGLSKGGSVQYNGIKVGEVARLKLAPSDPRRVLVRIRVEADTPIRQDTRARLGLAGVTGVAYVQLTGGSPESPPLVATHEHPVPEIPSETSTLTALLASGDQLTTILQQVGALLSDENVGHASRVLDNLDTMTSTVAAEREDLRTALHGLAGASGRLSPTLRGVDRMTASIDDVFRRRAARVLDRADATLQSTQQLANSGTALIERNRGAITDFSSQGLGQLGPTLVELRNTLRQLEVLSRTLTRNPSTLLRGPEHAEEFTPR